MLRKKLDTVEEERGSIGRPSEPVDLYKGILWILVALMLVVLMACATGAKENGADSSKTAAGRDGAPMRLVLARNVSLDSVRVINDFAVDQVIRQILDSVPGAAYLTLNHRDSLAALAVKQGKQGVGLAELGEKLDLDGAIATRVARFGSVLAVETQILEPATGRTIFRDVAYGVIRHRDSLGTMHLGPALRDVLRKSLARFFGLPHDTTAPVATEPLVMTGIVIPKEAALGRLSTLRTSLGETTLSALSDFANLHYPELVAFDLESRDRLYETVGVGAVENTLPMKSLERKALYDVGIERYLTGLVAAAPPDSVRLRLELRSVVSPVRDTLVEYGQMVFPVSFFQSTTAEDDFVVTMIDIAEALLSREAERLRDEYAKRTNRGK